MANRGSIQAMKTEVDTNIVPFNNAQLITGKKLNDVLQDSLDTIDALKADVTRVATIEGKIPSGASSSNKLATASDLDNKVDKVTGKGLSTNDYTNADKEKVDASLSDAPSDGQQYGRKNGAWAVISGGGGGGVDIIDNLTSDRADAALSAKQGKVLKGLVDGTAEDIDSLGVRMTTAEADIDSLENNVTSLDGRIDTIEDNYAEKVSVVSTIPVGGLLPNTFYNVGTLSSATNINLASGTAGELNLYHIRFSTGATAPTITWDASITAWQGGSAPTINANKTYEVSILDGIGIAMEV